QLLGPAVRAYLDGREPRPLRFLSAAGSDSAMPNAGMLVLQDRGPTYFYPPDSAGRETVRQRLGETYWPSLLVTYHGVEREGDESANVRLGGTWISGEMDGESAGYEDVGFLCRSGRWVPVDSVIPPPDDSLQRRPSA